MYIIVRSTRILPQEVYKYLAMYLYLHRVQMIHFLYYCTSELNLPAGLLLLLSHWQMTEDQPW